MSRSSTWPRATTPAALSRANTVLELPAARTECPSARLARPTSLLKVQEFASDAAADRAVTVVDGFITIQGETKIDALILEIRCYARPISRLKMAVPYRRAVDGARFAVHRPKFIVAQLEGYDRDALGQAFLRGI